MNERTVSTHTSGALARILRHAAAVMGCLLAAPVILVPWVIDRVSRRDPMRNPPGWTDVMRGAEPATGSPRRTSHASPSSGHGRRRRKVLLACASAACLLAVPEVRAVALSPFASPEPRPPFELGVSDGWALADDFPIRDPVPDDLEERPGDPDGVEAAMEDSAWFTDSQAYNTAQGWALGPSAAWRPINPYRLLDFTSLYLKIINGSRASWRPPECGCRRLRVWVYGGSTTYGLNQRDGHTIPSELARVAHENGITIDVDNRGQMGHLHWMEAERFAWDLTIEEPPDMVIFYDGVNEGWAASTLNAVGAGDIKPMRDPTTFDLWDDTGRSDQELPGPPGARFIGTPDDVSLQAGTLEKVMVERYDRARTLSRTAAQAHGVEVRYIWQPSRVSRPLVESEPHSDAQLENAARASEQYTRALLPDDVIDVADALRGSREPLFTDDVHHNETASRLIAEAIYERIGDDLESMAESTDR